LSDRSKWFRIFLATKLGVFSDSEESLKLFSNYPSMISNTRSFSKTQRVRERERASDLELELWVFLLLRNKSGSGGASIVVWGGGGCVDISQFPGPEN
jgi:hypothetical protein